MKILCQNYFISHIKEIINLSNKKELKEEDLGNLSEKILQKIYLLK